MSSSQSSSSEQKFNYSYSPASGQYQVTNVHFPSHIGHNIQLNVNSFSQNHLSSNLQNYSLAQMHQHHQFINNFRNQYYSKKNLEFDTNCEDYDDEQSQQLEELENKNDDSNLKTKLNNQLMISSTDHKTPNKIRKRSANQAYEYLTSLADSKTFQTWLSNNETDFTWVHKRNSMTNAGKKYYYICNYRIKKGYHRCPAVIYALFPNNNDSTVMVYSCGEHEHKRISLNDNSKHSETNSIRKIQGNKSKTVQYQSLNGSYSSSSASTPPSVQNTINNSQILSENYVPKNDHDDDNTSLNEIDGDDQDNTNRIKLDIDNDNYDDIDELIEDDENLNQDINNNEPLTSQNKNFDGTNEKSDHSKYINCKSVSLSNQNLKPQPNISSYLNPLRQLNINKQFQEFSLINSSNKSLINSNYLLAKALSAQQHNHSLGLNQTPIKQQNQKKRTLSTLNERFECDEEFLNSSLQSIQNNFNSNCHQMNNISMYPHHHHYRYQTNHLTSNLMAQQQALVNHLSSNRLSLNPNYVQGNKSSISNQISSILPTQTIISHQSQAPIINPKDSSTVFNQTSVNSNRNSPSCAVNLNHIYIP